MNGEKSYHEQVLHWLWEHRFLDQQSLCTNTGDEVVIHHPGYYNKTDGPDFINARITIGNLKWHGDIEIHWHAGDWLKHGHQKDPAFNRVVLHVIYEKTGKQDPISRQDQTSIPTLCLKPFLEKPLQYFFHRYQKPNPLPCSNSLYSVPDNIIKEQFDEIHQAYFEQKVDDYLQFYDASLPLSKAWKQALLIAIFDNLGISHNRDPMKKLAELLLKKPDIENIGNLICRALSIAGIEPRKNRPNFSWNKKGSRPANRPKNRIKQGCYIMHFTQNKELSWWLRADIADTFTQMTNQINTTPGLGKHQADVLFGTVWLPAYYLLGDLTGNKYITANSMKAWANHRVKLPRSIHKRFAQADMPRTAFARKLGTVHQYRSLCKPKQCQQCKIFQSIISS